MFEDEMGAALGAFFVEVGELLTEMETGLLAIETAGRDPELVNAVFRAAHTIKGSSGLFGFDDVVQLTHAMESVLDKVRSDEIEFSPQLVEVLLPCKDEIAAMVAAHAAGTGPARAAEQLRVNEELIARLDLLLAAPSSTPSVEPERVNDTPGLRLVHLSVRFGSELLQGGLDPLSFIDFLSTSGTVECVEVMTAGLPELAEMDPELCHVGFEITYRTALDVASIEDIFEFVRAESDIRVLDATSSDDDVDALAESYGADGERVRELLAPVLATRAAEADVIAAPVARGAAGPSPDERVATAEIKTIRVDAARLDRLIDTVGEMVIAGAGANLHAAGSESETLKASIAEVMRLIEGVRDDALRLRMVPIGSTFGRFQRVVRDVSASLGKEVVLTVTGGDTEVDKALVERIGDPLMHLVRNALDHGIEATDVRLARGKPAGGSLTLRAFHDSGTIVIEVEDDGGGIDTERVRAKAIERGLIDAGASLSDREIHGLIFEPGFSTASEVSDLSGRGVGMDVVKRNVTALRGTIEIDSIFGRGTTIRIRMPLTLAIIDGFMVSVGTTTFVIPLDRVVECVERPANAKERDYMDLRGSVLPLIPMRRRMHIEGDPPRRENVVVVDHGGLHAGLVVDTLLGEFQTVIKPLGPMFAQARGIGGSTILGNGDVALIVDVPTLVGSVVEG